MTPGLILALERCTTAAAEPLVILFIFQGRTPLTGGRGDEVVPSGVDWIRFRVLEADERQRLLFRYMYGRTKRISDITRGDRRVKLTLDSARGRNRGPGAIR